VTGGGTVDDSADVIAALLRSRDCDLGVDFKDCARLERPILFNCVKCDNGWHCT